MGSSFDRWLAKPSTICLLRRLIQSETGHHVPPRRPWPARRHQSTTTAADERKDTKAWEAAAQRPVDHVSLYRHRRLTSSRRVLFMSLRSGVSILPQDMDIASSWKEIGKQADVDSDKLLGTLVVDEPENLHNMALWAEILDQRQRWHGRQGAEAVWNGMRKRGVHLPTDGEEADLLWTAFVQGSMVELEDHENADGNPLLLQIFEYAKELYDTTGKRYSALYHVMIGRLLRLSPKLARSWHVHLIEAGLAHTDDIMSVLTDVMQCRKTDEAQRKFFFPWYEETERRGMYDMVIGEALKQGLHRRKLWRYHRFFLANGDTPSQQLLDTAAVQELYKLGRAKFFKSRSQDATAKAGKHSHSVVTRETMSGIMGDLHGIQPKELSDTFCARMFATRAFSVEWVIRGLAIVGAERLGPLALRELAVRTGSLQEFRRDIQELEKVGISTGDSVFSRLLLKVAAEGNEELWKALVQSDQHPETYENPRKQSDLLVAFLGQGNWMQAHLSLLAASLAGAEVSHTAWNRVFQYYILNRDYHATASTLQSMQYQKIALTQYTLTVLRSHILPTRHPGKRQLKGHGPGFFEPTEFVANAYIYAALHQSRSFAHPRQWAEVLKRLGMNHQWESLERVVLHLLDTFEDKEPCEREDHDSLEESIRRILPLQTIFDLNMRKALFIWGFRSASVRDKLRPPASAKEGDASTRHGSKGLSVEQWAQGLPLLQRLQEQGLDFDLTDIRVVFAQRMMILFGPAYSTRAVNHEARRNNRLSLAHYIRHANEVWPGLIDWIHPEYLERDDDLRLLPAFFGPSFLASVKRDDYVDVKAWARTLESGASRIVEPKKTRQKEAAWLHSPLRVQYRPLQPAATASPSVTIKPISAAGET